MKAGRLNFAAKKGVQVMPNDMGGVKRYMRFAGQCIYCGHNTYEITEDNGITWREPDARGAIPPIHCAACFEPKDFGMVGPDVPCCYQCKTEKEVYDYVLRMARKQWSPAEQNNCCGSGPHALGEVRVLPLGPNPDNGNMIVCKRCYQREIDYRIKRNRDLSPESAFKLPAWETLEVYTA